MHAPPASAMVARSLATPSISPAANKCCVDSLPSPALRQIDRPSRLHCTAAEAMATGGSYGARRLSDLLQEQQEPFLLLLEAPPQRLRSPVVEACGRRLRNLLCGGGGYKTTTASARKKDLLLQYWDDLAACFTCAAPRQRFRRLPRAGDIGDEVVGGNKQQLSPVSVLDQHSDGESTELISHSGDEEDDGKPSTSAHDDVPGAAAKPCSTFVITNGVKVRAVEAGAVQGNDSKRLQSSSAEQAIVSEWERIAADISRIPTLVALSSSGSFRRFAADEVGQSIEAMIFEEVKWEAVRDMICLHGFLL
ncbi:hypothetical protein HU200_060894 [Digitaria exilis]|uniref:Uncharacterized protein n=1 Tax=Digitaria exilis TaxID=1010633 RepID=A0A835A9I6_9POAL|nr:hypothetical protein HU200_060894 [Digitaria exilis]